MCSSIETKFEWNKNIFSFAEYILFTLDKIFYRWIVNGGVQNERTNISISKFIILRSMTKLNIKTCSQKPTQTWSSLHELIENKKACYRACMVTYKIGDWIKAGMYLRKRPMGPGPLPFFHTDQIVSSLPIK